MHVGGYEGRHLGGRTELACARMEEYMQMGDSIFHIFGDRRNICCDGSVDLAQTAAPSSRGLD
jgi:hypothetical protein